MASAEILAGTVSAVLVGRSALPRDRGLSAAALAEDFLLGLSVVVPLAFAWGLGGLPWSPMTMPALAVGAALVLRRVVGDRDRVSAVRLREAPRPIDRAAELLLALCVLLAAWKWMRTPMWSWDHFAIWGLKARRMIVDGSLDLAFLRLHDYGPSNPDYPVGLPLATRFLSPSIPSSADFRAVHALFGISLLAATHGAARRLGASRAAAALLAAALCASPLFWDTEAVGLADLPLAAFAASATLLALEARAPGVPAWPAGVALGFLSWVKLEGIPLGAFLALALAVGLGGKKRLALAVPWAWWTAAALATRESLLPASVGFLEGDWRSRFAERARDPLTLFSAMGRELAGPEWLGLWFLFAAAALGALLLRTRSARALTGVVVAQFLFYAFVYFGTFHDPSRHIESSFHRITAALLPLALLAMAAVSGPLRKKPSPA